MAIALVLGGWLLISFWAAPAGVGTGMLGHHVLIPLWLLGLLCLLTTLGMLSLASLLRRRDRLLITKERRARLAEQRLIDAIDAIPDGFALFDRLDRLVVSNEAYRRIYAQSAAAIVPGATFESILRYGLERGQYASAAGRPEQWLAERLDAHRTPRGALEQELPDGRWLHIEERRTEAGDTVGIRSDITALKQRELHLESQTALLKTTFSHISEGITIIDADGFLVDSNREFRRLLQIPDDMLRSDIRFVEMLDFTCAKDRRFDGHDVEDIGDAVRRILSGSRARLQWVSSQGTAVDICGSPLPAGGHVVTFADVTAHRSMLERLQASEAQKSGIIAASIDAVIIADERGRVLEFNRAAESLFGYSSAEALGCRLQDLIIPPDLRATHATALARFLHTGEKSIIDKRVEVPAIDKHGRQFPVEITISATRVAHRYVFSAYMRDITERKRVEEERESAREAAEAASRAKSDFLAMVSHELRTPMNGIIGLSSLLLDTPLSSEQRRFADGIDVSASHLLNLVNEILDFSRVEAGRIDINPQSFLLSSLVESVIDTTRVLVRGRPIEVEGLVDSRVPPVVIGDAGRLQQVLQNLLGNSAKFTDKGRIALHVQSLGMLEDRHRVRLTVLDTGAGIPESFLPRLFEPFEQGDGSNGQRYQGTGLGLAITRRIVELMGGTIQVESTLGQGTRFDIDLVLGEGELTEVAEEDRNGGAKLGTETGSPLRVLVAEDAPVNQLVVRTMLERSGHVVRVVNDGSEAVEAVRNSRFDLVIMDIQMPGMSGWEALAEIRRLPPPQGQVPLVALTAQATANDVARALKAGFDRHISKPVRRNDLLLAISEVMEARGAGKAAPAPETPLLLPSACRERDAPAGLPEKVPGNEVDFSALEELRVGVDDDAFFRTLVDRFLGDSGTMLKEMSSCLEASDHDALKRLAHKLAGLLGQFGCMQAAAACGALEGLPHPAEAGPQVRDAIDQGVTAIDTIRSSMADPGVNLLPASAGRR